MTRIPYFHRGAATEESFTNSVAALGDHHYVKTNSIHGQHDLHHEQQQQYLQQQHRRLEDYYAYTPDSSSTTQQQHPWYTHAMLLILIALIAFTVLYATYELYRSRQIRSMLLKAHCATRPLCDDDMSDVYSMQQSTASQQQAEAEADATVHNNGCSIASSEWKNTTQMEMVFPSSSKPSYDDEASASSLSPRNHNEYISMSGGDGDGDGGGGGGGGGGGDDRKSGVAA